MKPRREHLVNFYPLKSPSPSYANGLPIISRCFYFLFFFPVQTVLSAYTRWAKTRLRRNKILTRNELARRTLTLSTQFPPVEQVLHRLLCVLLFIRQTAPIFSVGGFWLGDACRERDEIINTSKIPTGTGTDITFFSVRRCCRHHINIYYINCIAFL